MWTNCLLPCNTICDDYFIYAKIHQVIKYQVTIIHVKSHQDTCKDKDKQLTLPKQSNIDCNACSTKLLPRSNP